jgi:hypothetical protein
MVTTFLRRLSAVISVVPVLKQLAPATLRHAIYDRLLDREIPFYPDRVHMRDVILPILARHPGTNVLNVGCRRYSVDINSQLKAAGKSVSTIDIDPDAARMSSETQPVSAFIFHRARSTSCFSTVSSDSGSTVARKSIGLLSDSPTL